MRIDRIHITGASGSGTSTLGRALSQRYGYVHLDTDNFFWEPTDPPYERQREVTARQRMLAEALDASARWVLSGSLCGWGDIFIPRFEMVVFLFVPHGIRMARLERRELSRYGSDALAPVGNRWAAYEAFMKWAATYDTADETTRSLQLHNRWLMSVPSEVIRIEGATTVEQQVARLDRLLA